MIFSFYLEIYTDIRYNLDKSAAEQVIVRQKIFQFNIRNKRVLYQRGNSLLYKDADEIQAKELRLMRYVIRGGNIEVTEALKNAIYEKIGKLQRYFTPDTEVHVTFSVEKENHKVEVTIPMKGNLVRAEQSSGDMYTSIDRVEEVIERQLRKYKNKLVDQKQSAQSLSQIFIEEEISDEEDIIISKVKHFAMKPMDAEEACVQMELIGHNFYVFRNAETDEVNVVYKRKNGTFGLIEPEF